MIGDSNDETNFSHKLLLTDTQVFRIHEAFANDSSANKNLSKTQLPKMVQLSGGFFLLFFSANPESLTNSVQKNYKGFIYRRITK